MRVLLIAALVAVFSSQVMAAEVTPTITTADDSATDRPQWTWETVTENDTFGSITWPGGAGLFHATGTQATAEFSVSADTFGGSTMTAVSELPFSSGGALYTGVSGLGYITCFQGIPRGATVGIKFKSAGSGTQDLDGFMTTTDKCR